MEAALATLTAAAANKAKSDYSEFDCGSTIKIRRSNNAQYTLLSTLIYRHIPDMATSS
jgi:hypothetical protein